MVEKLTTASTKMMHTWIYSTHELYSALGKCEDGNIDDASGAPHAWDEGWAFWAGSLATADGDDGDGELMYSQADARGHWFATSRERVCPAIHGYATCPAGETCCWAPSWREDDDSGTHSDANYKLLLLYRAGLVALQAGDCATATALTAEIVAQMTVPLVQNAIKYTWWADAGGGDGVDHEDGRFVANMHASVSAVLPRVASCDAAAAATLEANIALPDAMNPPSGDGLVPDGFRAVKAAIESTYACLGITCAEVGGLLNWDDDRNSYHVGMEPCDDGSSKDDWAARAADLEAMANGLAVEDAHDAHDSHAEEASHDSHEDHDDHDGHDHGDGEADAESDGARSKNVGAALLLGSALAAALA